MAVCEQYQNTFIDYHNNMGVLIAVLLEDRARTFGTGVIHGTEFCKNRLAMSLTLY